MARTAVRPASSGRGRNSRINPLHGPRPATRAGSPDQRSLGFFAEGKLKYAETIVEGFENTPQAFIGLFTGNNLMIMACASGRVSPRELLRAWAVVYVGNLLGALGIAALVWVRNGLNGIPLFWSFVVAALALIPIVFLWAKRVRGPVPALVALEDGGNRAVFTYPDGVPVRN